MKRTPTKLTPLGRVLIDPRAEQFNDVIGQSGIFVPGASNNIGAAYSHLIGYDVATLPLTDAPTPYPVGVITSTELAAGTFTLSTRNALLGVGSVIFGFAGGAIQPIAAGGDNVDAVATGTSGRLFVNSRNYGFNGTTFDRLRSGADNADAVASSTLGILRVAAEGFAFNGATFDRRRSGTNASDAVATVATGNANTLAFTYGFNGTTFDRLRAAANNADAVAVSTVGSLQSNAANYGFNGTTWDRLRSQGNNASGVAVSTLGLLGTAAYLYVFNGATWDRWNGGSTSATVAGATADNADAVAVAANLSLRTTAENYGFNGVSWDRIRSQGNSADGLATTSLGVLDTAAYPYVLNDTTGLFDRIRGLPYTNLTPQIVSTAWTQAVPTVRSVMLTLDNQAGTGVVPAWTVTRSWNTTTDGLILFGNGVLVTSALSYGFNGATFDRIRSGGDNSDGIGTSTLGRLITMARNTTFDVTTNTWALTRSYPSNTNPISGTATNTHSMCTIGFNYAHNGTDWAQLKNNSAANISRATQPDYLSVALPGNWTVVGFPGVLNTQATATKAAGGAGVRHVCTGIFASLRITGGTANAVLVLRDGATGAGAILWEQELALSAIATDKVNISGLNIFGTANTAMTLEFTAASGATSVQSVTITGYSTV